MQALGGIDILVNGAAAPGGTVPSAKIEQVNGENLLFDVNVKVAGYMRAAKAAAPHMAKNGWGRIINIGGGAARHTGNYIASVRNAAVSSLTKNLADELGAKGINVVAIHPGTTKAGQAMTEEFEKRMRRRSASAGSSRRRRSPISSPSSPRPKASRSTARPSPQAAASSGRLIIDAGYP